MSGVSFGMLDPYGKNLFDCFKASVGSDFHWFAWQFRTFAEDSGIDDESTRLLVKGFVLRIVSACREVEKAVPGFGVEFIGRLAAVKAKAKNIQQYEQLLQLLAELFILRRVATYSWPEPVKFDYEPPSSTSKKNPEIIVRCQDFEFGVEVKCPAILNHVKARGKKGVQAVGRAMPLDSLQGVSGGDVMLPRDNPIKDFLISANEKFAGHQRAGFFGLLFIFWDEFLNEPISALTNPGSGLLTDNSFHKEDGIAVKYPHVDGVVLVPSFHILSYATGHEGINGFVDFLDYGDPNEYPFRALVPVSTQLDKLPGDVLACCGAHPHDTLIGAEYQPTDSVLWIETRPHITDA